MLVNQQKDHIAEAAHAGIKRLTISGGAEANGKNLYLGLAEFSPGTRTFWHTHDYEQSLIIVEGKGIVATEDQEHVVETGDVIVIPEPEVWAIGNLQLPLIIGAGAIIAGIVAFLTLRKK